MSEDIIKDDELDATETVVETEAPAAIEDVEEPKVAENVVKVDEPVVTEEPALGAVKNGAIGVSTKEVKPKKEASAPKKAASTDDKVAIFSSKNVILAGVGQVKNGYNIVSKEEAEVWLKRSHVRLADADEVKRAFGR